jgi:hypothetical protein
VADAPPRRRRVLLLAGATAVVAGLVVVVVLVARARQVERSVPALCEQLALAQDLDQSLTTLDPSTLGPQVAALRRAARVAPTEIRDAVATVADYVAEIADEVDSTTDDRRQVLADALAARQEAVDVVAAAGADVDRWAQQNCGLTLSGPSASARTDGGATGPAGDDRTSGAPTDGAGAGTGGSGGFGGG